MSFTQELYLSAKPIWDSYYDHPFVEGIGKDTLSKEKFKFYLIQDYLYLLDYAKLFALGVVKSRSEEDMQKFSNLTDGILNSEMGIHRVYMKKLGLTTEDILINKPTIENLSYTHYMLSVANNYGVKEIAIAVLACMWSYQMIALELSKRYGNTQEFYGDWIKAYTSDSYDSLNKWLFDLVEKSVKNSTIEDKEYLKEIFINCSIYEYKFWDMAFKGE